MKPSQLRETSAQIVRVNDRLSVYTRRLRDFNPTKRHARAAYEAATLLAEAQALLVRVAMVLDNSLEEPTP